MVDDPRKDILLEPLHSIIVDGLGYSVLSLGGVPAKDQNGKEVIKFVIKVDEVVRKRYGLRKGVEIDDNNTMHLVVDKLDLIPMNMYDDTNRKWLYVKSLDHHPTEISRREENLKTLINSRERRILLLDAEIIRLSEQLELARTNAAKFISQSGEVYEKAYASASRNLQQKEENK